MIGIVCAVWGTILILLFLGSVFTMCSFMVDPKGWDQVKQYLHPKLLTACLLWVFGGIIFAIWWGVFHA